MRPSRAAPDWSYNVGCYDPARVLREVAAKRAIIALHQAVPGLPGRLICDVCWSVGRDGGPLDGDLYPCATVCQLAAVYSNHPDYRQEWKP